MIQNCIILGPIQIWIGSETN